MSTGDGMRVAGSMSKGDGVADVPQTKERIRYVEVAPSTGWPMMAKAVRDLDIEKVQDYKEDIDTLLVFAGLYSAVLSAFLVESYTNLLPDRDGQMVYLLQQIAAQTQSYTLVAGHLNTTARPQDPPSTAIPRWAVHVNALWFASLIISLSVASYGMLVKQWLREYLAMEYTAPQDRLRARQYRRPSLDNWKVFEIASALPILLQVSLGLFFAGICIFTNSFNDEIAHLSLPLVCAWAAFFVFAALAPLMSPRCPYKTPFLKGILERGRKLGIWLPLYTITFIGRLSARGRELYIQPIIYIVYHIVPFKFLMLGQKCCVQATLRALSSVIAYISPKPIVLDEKYLTFAEEEKQFISHDQDDATILLATDEITADDNFLPMMLDIYRPYTERHPEQGVSLALSLLSHRIGGVHLKTPLRTIPSLMSVSRKAYESILDFVAEIVVAARIELTLGRQDWELDACLLFLAESPHPPSDRTQALRKKLFDKGLAEVSNIVIAHANREPYAAWLQVHRVMRALGMLPNDTKLLDFYHETFKAMKANPVTSSSPSLHAALCQRAAAPNSEQMHPSLRCILDTIMNEAMKPSDSLDVHGLHYAIFVESSLIILDFAPTAHAEDEIGGVLWKAWKNEQMNAAFLIYGYCSMWLCPGESEKQKRHRRFRQHLWQERGWTDILKTLMHVIETHSESFGASPSQAPMDMLRCCELFLLFDSWLNEWRSLLEALAVGLRRYHEKRPWETTWTPPLFMLHDPSIRIRTPEEIVAEDRDLAERCLETVAILKSFYRYTNQIPDALVDALRLFTSTPPPRTPPLPEHIVGVDADSSAAEIVLLEEIPPDESSSDPEDTPRAGELPDQNVSDVV